MTIVLFSSVKRLQIIILRKDAIFIYDCYNINCYDCYYNYGHGTFKVKQEYAPVWGRA